jgi:hypothetical protein
MSGRNKSAMREIAAEWVVLSIQMNRLKDSAGTC